jgi:hypothetical protein
LPDLGGSRGSPLEEGLEHRVTFLGEALLYKYRARVVDRQPRSTCTTGLHFGACVTQTAGFEFPCPLAYRADREVRKLICQGHDPDLEWYLIARFATALYIVESVCRGTGAFGLFFPLLVTPGRKECQHNLSAGWHDDKRIEHDPDATVGIFPGCADLAPCVCRPVEAVQTVIGRPTFRSVFGRFFRHGWFLFTADDDQAGDRTRA